MRVAIAARALVVCALASASAFGCGSSSHAGDANGGASGGSSQPVADAGHAASGSGGEHGASGSGGQLGAADAGNGQSGGGASGSASGGSSGGATPSDGGGAACTAKCSSDQHCELVQVTCIRAPCPPQPTCVANAVGGKSCGSRGLSPCASGEFCNFGRAAMCGDADSPGTCMKLSQICQDIYKPVCGCDGQTYANECVANAAGVSVRSDAACASADAAAPLDCDPRKILCKRVAPVCPQGEVPSVSGSCYGDCVPVESCPCQGPEQCPQPGSYTCHMSAAHCGPFV